MLALGGRALSLIVGGGALGLLVNAVRSDGVSLLSFAAPTACMAEEGVALVPGGAFGDDRWVRLSYSVSDRELETALAML